MKALIKKEQILTFVALFFLAATCFTQDAITVKVDDFIKNEMQKQRIPGVSLAVVKDGKVVLEKGYGFSNIEHQVAVKPETIFQSGSVGKQFTATAVMLLVEDGKISLDEKIGKYLGEVPESWKSITVRHLLTHTGGMTDYTDDFDFRRDYTEEELLTRAKAVPLAFQPGEKWQYSNLGYVTLGILIHKVSGKFYGDFLQERVFKPLGMTTARIINEADIVPNRSAGYMLVKGELKHQEWVSPTLNTTADGALYLTVKDMVKWDAALNGEKLLKQTSLYEMWTPVKLNNGNTHPYGFGWALGEVNKQRIIEHGGSWQGFKAFIARYPDSRLTVIVFANLAQTNPDKLAHGVAAIYEPSLAQIPPKAIADKDPKVTAMVKEVLQKSADGTVDPSLFSTESRAVLFPDRIKAAGQFLKSLGTLNEIQPLEQKTEGETRIYRYRAIYKEQVLLLRMNLDKEGKISLINFQPE